MARVECWIWRGASTPPVLQSFSLPAVLLAQPVFTGVTGVELDDSAAHNSDPVPTFSANVGSIVLFM